MKWLKTKKPEHYLEYSILAKRSKKHVVLDFGGSYRTVLVMDLKTPEDARRLGNWHRSALRKLRKETGKDIAREIRVGIKHQISRILLK